MGRDEHDHVVTSPGPAATSDTPPDPTAPHRRVRQIAAASVGNAVEWFDWFAFVVLAVYFADRIFAGSAGSALLTTFAIFALGFVMRPVGGLVLGWLADRRGRRWALGVTISVMGAGSLLVAVVPTYEQAGPWGAVVLVVARLLQGFSLGGEFAASSTFLVETAPPGRRGLFSSVQPVTATLGQLAASGLTALLVAALDPTAMASWGWRVPFAVGAVMALVGLWVRRGAVETRPALATSPAPPGPFDALREHPRASLLIVGLTAGGAVAYYAWTSFLPTWIALTSGAPPVDALLVGSVALLFFTLLQPLVGAWSDRVGRRLPLLVFAVGAAVTTVPLFLLASPGTAALLVVQCVGLALTSGYTAVAAAVNAELFPARTRAAGLGLPYAFTVAAIGGTVPYVGALLADLDAITLFPIYVVALCIVSAVVFLSLPETAFRRLD